jgi:hypothetical protein
MRLVDAAFLFGVVAMGITLAVMVGLLVFKGARSDRERARLRAVARLLALAYAALFAAWFVIQVI